jgi:hypothetical protein
MHRSFIVTLDLDPSANIPDVEKEMFESLTYDFPELITVKAFQEKGMDDGPRPIEGEITLGGMPMTPAPTTLPPR